MCVSGGKKCQFFGKLCERTKLMIPKNNKKLEEACEIHFNFTCFTCDILPDAPRSQKNHEKDKPFTQRTEIISKTFKDLSIIKQTNIEKIWDTNSM